MKTLHISDELHKQAKVAATLAGMDLKTWVEEAIKEKLAKEK